MQPATKSELRAARCVLCAALVSAASGLALALPRATEDVIARTPFAAALLVFGFAAAPTSLLAVRRTRQRVRAGGCVFRDKFRVGPELFGEQIAQISILGDHQYFVLNGHRGVPSFTIVVAPQPHNKPESNHMSDPRPL